MPAGPASSGPGVDGNMYELSEDISLEKNLKHRIDIVVDRLIVRRTSPGRLTDSVETASNLANGLVTVNLLREERDITFSQNYACDDCGISIEELTPRLFSFNSPFGACPTCTGLGLQLKADPALIIPDGANPSWRAPLPPPVGPPSGPTASVVCTSRPSVRNTASP